jgi:diguanylate cyclase (GGDEF)-like protein
VEETTQTIVIDSILSDDLDTRPLSACLVIISGANIGHQHQITVSQSMVGRSMNADIQIDDDSASRDHAFIIRDTSGYRVRDNNSKNGCFLNDTRVDEHQMQDGDLLRIGGTILKFLSGNDIEQAYHEELFNLAKVDGLTNIYNRRHFTASLESEIDRARRYNRELSLMMIDIDHFKNINDTLGHRAGDHVLKELAAIIVNRSRRVDYVCRYGGEEFAIIMPEVDIMGAFKFAVMLKDTVCEHSFLFEHNEIHITVSIGVSDNMEGDQTADELTETTDRRLYLAKERGRNRVISAD